MDGTAYIGLGSNLGNRAEHLRQALERLARDTLGVRAVSRLYESAPLYVVDQPAFLNAAASLAVDVDPPELLARLKAIEAELGRVETFRFGPRAIDLDILLWGDDGATELRTPTLTIPHPRLLERAFALLPLADLVPELVHPLCGLTIGELASSLTEGGATPIAEPDWPSSESKS